MTAATATAKELAEWSATARSMFPAQVELHITATTYELRCEGMRPLVLEPTR